MVRQVDHSRFAGRGGIVDRQRIITPQRIGHIHMQLAWETILAIFAHGAESDAAIADRLCLPYAVMECHFASAVQAVAVVIFRHSVFDAVHSKARVCNSVCNFLLSFSNKKTKEVADNECYTFFTNYSVCNSVCNSACRKQDLQTKLQTTNKNVFRLFEKN